MSTPIIRTLETFNFRNLKNTAVTFSDQFNVLEGPNGHGKTSLIEAIYCACHSKSFRTNQLMECITHTMTTMRTACHIEKTPISNWIETRIENGKKSIRIDDRPTLLPALLEAVSLLCITGDHLRIIAEGPEYRRRFFDGMIALFFPGYLHSLAECRRILRQRGAMLRAGARLESLDPWNHALARSNRTIVRFRQHMVELLHPFVTEEPFSGNTLVLTYRPSGGGVWQDEAEAVRMLNVLFSRESAARRCLSGMHRDEFEIGLDGKETRQYASSGQKRSVLYALYFAALKCFNQRRGHYPVLLIDDVDMELDRQRINRLFSLLDCTTQIFLTTAKPELVPSLPATTHRFTVLEGAVNHQRGGTISTQ